MRTIKTSKSKHYANEFTSVDQIAQYTYDLYGRRIQKTVNGIVTNFLWDEDNISLELNENNQPIRRYVYGVGMDNVEGHFEYAEATSNPFATDKKGWYTYIKDQVGTIYKTFSHGTSQVVNTRAFDTFGNLISQSGTSKSPLGFQSKYLDPESGLYYFYHRYYSPSLGRFTTEDPIGLNGGNNMFSFVKNNPLNLNDKYGLICIINERITALLSVGPISSYIGGVTLRNEAWRESQATGLSGQIDGAQDAWRHCYWSCRMAQEIGVIDALLIGGIHEECNKQKCEIKKMDMHNNYIGLKSALHGSNDCKLNCWAALIYGNLQTSPPLAFDGL